MRTIYLVRHGDYENSHNIMPGRLPVPLSQRGIDEAERLKSYFADKEINRIYSSPVLRAYKTSEIISDTVIPIFDDVCLAETFSAYQGMWYDQEVDWKSDLYGHRETLGGESIQDQYERMISFWKEKIEGTEENCIIVSHWHPLWALYCYLTHTELPFEDEAVGEIGPDLYMKKGDMREITIENGKIIVGPVITL